MTQQSKPPWRKTLNYNSPKTKVIIQCNENDQQNPYQAITQMLPTDYYQEKKLFAQKTCRGRLPAKEDEGRRPYGVKQIDNNIPLGIYDVDCGEKQGIVKNVQSSQQQYASAFKSRRNRFLSVPAYKMSTFANNAKEPYANPEKIGPGTYKLRPTTLVIKNLHDPNFTFTSQVDRFVTPTLPYNEPQEIKPVPSTLGKLSTSKISMSTTPRFSSNSTFPENYSSSKQQRIFYAPDIIYDKPLNKDTIHQRIKTSNIKYTTMTSITNRLVSTAAMVHNTVQMPILPTSTSSDIGPGTYKATIPSINTAPTIAPERQKNRFDLKPNVHYVEARFRRFC
ncbi:hypothetical protein THRCLA_08963 [Thraustotheca clavata]|uniref:Uncharacterized protein n=1 Tax=Thraustotheca clavata TaxID=74557 RepID=A0A1V9Z0H1_9STRA|nr:hypothetical protein THRCLA_08963 [Thraustotheca clavata]